MSALSRALASLGPIGVLVLGLDFTPAFAGEVPGSAPVKIAVFDFTLEDASPSEALLGRSTSRATAMDTVSAAARSELARSGRYTVIDPSQVAAAQKSLQNCNGCEATVALQLGAEQSLAGVVTKVTQTDYYVRIQIRDARSGKLLDQEEANFAGGEEGWATGVRMLIKHQILAGAD
ncbi:MAG TPA: DUF2380 domain-containing protein [Steroidobacteraceae bacterium]|nr:DUF2380 domain-containing protein [Steroidobacteraceae bacterium]